MNKTGRITIMQKRTTYTADLMDIKIRNSPAFLDLQLPGTTCPNSALQGGADYMR